MPMTSEDVAALSNELTDIDPLCPDLITVTPAELVAALTGPEREERVRALIELANTIVDQAWEVHGDDRTLKATCVLYSGGNDSTVLAHLMRRRANYAIHCNTTIGIEQTRQFVRDTCAQWQLPLLEEVAPIDYRTLVIEQGFPGPGHHFKMYQRLKERGLRQARRRLVSNGHRERVIFLAGRRRDESTRRSRVRSDGKAQVPLHEREGSVVWASPLAMWTKLDLNTYRLMHADTEDPVPVNVVSDLIHMSGECLCGAFAKPGELEEIRLWFPEMAEEIEDIAKEVRAAGHSEFKSTWGHGKVPSEAEGVFIKGRLCSSCDAPEDDSDVISTCTTPHRN